MGVDSTKIREAFTHGLLERYSPEMYEKISEASVAVAGLGGLGSHVALMLARAGVGRLLLVDQDEVEMTNLNRQAYGISQVGMPKTEALCQILREVNPCIALEKKNCRVTAENAAGLFRAYPIVCEAFDHPEAKSMLVNVLLEQCRDTVLVAGSGMAGIGSANEIHTSHPMKRLYLCGDGETELAEEACLMASRVTVCAAHQANMILRLILGIREV